MRWTERQREMLRAMGVASWTPAATASVTDSATQAPRSERAQEPAAAVLRPAPVHRPGAGAPRAASAGEAAAARHAAPSGDTQRPAADDARHDAIARMDWDALRSAAAACEACGLCRTRRQSVFGVGHPQAHWLVVGEAPGEQEDLQGEPFVGAAGQLLDAMLQALSLTRTTDGAAPPSQRVYIANTLKCRPPNNRNPAAEEMAACEPFLLRQIELLRPRIILAMGRFAVQALLRSSEPIGRLRGRVHRYHGVPLVVTYHPAYLLRNLPDKARAWEDLCLAAETAEATGVGVAQADESGQARRADQTWTR